MEDMDEYQVQKLLQPTRRCPRCNSDNTKFCYFNNYNFSQPRHYCKGCRRYWTHGGSLRNIPIGGCSHRSKRPRITSPPPPPPLGGASQSSAFNTANQLSFNGCFAGGFYTSLIAGPSNAFLSRPDLSLLQGHRSFIGGTVTPNQ